MQIDPSKRKEVHERLKMRCWFCGIKMTHDKKRNKATIDHLTPASRGGTNDESNLVPACRLCNFRKQTKTLEEFREYYRAKHPAAIAYEHLMAAVAEIESPDDALLLEIADRLEQRIPRVVFYGEKMA